MIRNRVKLLLVIALLIIIAGSVFVGIQIGKRQIVDQQPAIIPAPTVVKQTNEWKTYENRALGFSFLYPDNYRFEMGPGDINSVYFWENGTSSESFYKFNPILDESENHANPFFWFRIFPLNKLADWTTPEKDGPAEMYLVKDIDNINFSFKVYDFGTEYTTRVCASDAPGEGMVIFTCDDNRLTDPIFRQIISTFKFTRKIYKNDRNGFEFQYPSDLVLNESEQRIQTKSNNQIRFFAVSDKSLTIADYLVSADKISQTAWEGQPSMQVHSTKKTIINGLNCIQREEYLMAADITQINTYFKKGNVLVSIVLMPTPGNPLSDDELVYQQILSTFKFTGIFSPK